MTGQDIQFWIEALLRWIHVVAAILWVGQTYLFIFFERHVVRREGDPDDVGGSLWMVHGGGYYFLEKQGFSASTAGKPHSFKWEATVTWISGALLLAMVYYTPSMLIDGEAVPLNAKELPPVMGVIASILGALRLQPDDLEDLYFLVAAVTGVGLIIIGFVLYSIMLRTPLARNGYAMAAFGLIAIAVAHLLLAQTHSTRSAFFHIGALLGTIMAFNVVMGIIPAQKKILRALEEGRNPNPAVQALGLLRARHNSYMAIPLVFIMISNHYPTISYGHAASTALLVLVVLAGFIAARVLRGS